MRERVLLLHGIWMRGFMMARIAKHLAAQGYAVDVIDYPSLSKGADACADDLRARIDAQEDEAVHVVGHSLGGLVALLATQDCARAGRTVCLGSPLTGSAAAKTLSTFAPWMMGRSRERLLSGLGAWRGAREVGVIAGRVPVGMALFLGGLSGDNDGTVAVEETRLPGIRDHAVIAATHTGLPFSDEAIAMTAHFLRVGRFSA
ncbi:MAG TPA: alpha/beta fold hydrolase [Pseudomonadota bacterium]|nr:alpha/beta fold hydrolase [Pseudomonadota bacterium]